MRMEKPDLSDVTDPKVRQSIEDFHRWYDRASLAEQIAWQRARAVRACRTNRKILRLTDDPHLCAHASSTLRSAQIRLLRIRIWRATGVCPGEG